MTACGAERNSRAELWGRTGDSRELSPVVTSHAVRLWEPGDSGGTSRTALNRANTGSSTVHRPYYYSPLFFSIESKEVRL